MINNTIKSEKSAQARQKEKYLTQMQPLLEKRVIKEVENREIAVKFTKYGNKHLYSDTFGRAVGLKKEDLKNLDAALKNAEFVKSANISKERKDSIVKFYYFKDKSKELYYNVAERIYWHKGIEHIDCFLYSVTNAVK